MKDFIGLSVHSKAFETTPYQGICEQVRDYHNLAWDIGRDPATPTRFPKGAISEGEGWVDWSEMYGAWTKAGFRIDACIQWNAAAMPPSKWTGISQQAYAYGKAFSDCLGSRGLNLVRSVEIRNDYDDATYLEIFENMAKGFHTGDPAMKVVTCVAGLETELYSRRLKEFQPEKNYFDCIAIRRYSVQPDGSANSYPENMRTNYLSGIQDLIDYRNINLPGKEIWITEFGFDASTKRSSTTRPLWTSLEDSVQADYIVRSFLLFSAMDLNRAYLFFFDDLDEPTFHGASGIMRHSKPKPSYYALRHLYQTLGEYRFARIVRRDEGNLFAYDYVRGADANDHVLVVWSPTEDGKSSKQWIDLPVKPVNVERLAMTESPAPSIPIGLYQDGKLQVAVDGSPVFIRYLLR